MCDKERTKAFTILEILLALSIWSLFITIFSQMLFIVKKAHKHEKITPLHCFAKILFCVKKGACFKMENNYLVFQTLDTKKTYKISFFEKAFREKDEVFIAVKDLKQVVWLYWNSDKKEWGLLNEESKTTPVLKLKLINKDNICFEEFVFNTAWPYFPLNVVP